MARISKTEFWSKVDSAKSEVVDRVTRKVRGSIHGFIWADVSFGGRWSHVCLGSVAVRDPSECCLLVSKEFSFVDSVRFVLD